MSSTSDSTAAQLRAFAWALGAGSLLRLAATDLGNSPRIALFAVLAGLLGVAASALAPLPLPRRGRRVAWAFAALALLVVLGRFGLAWTSAGLAFAAACVAAALFARALPGGASGRVLILSGPCVPLGLVYPVAGIAVALLIVVALDLRAEPWRSGAPEPSPRLNTETFFELLLGAAGAFLLSAVFFAVRAHLDPTPLGFAIGLGIASCAAGLAARGALGEARATLLALCAALSVAAVGLLPLLSYRLVAPLAGLEDPRLYLWLLLAAMVTPGGYALGLARRAGPLLLPALALGAWLGADSGASARSGLLVLGAIASLGAAIFGARWVWRVGALFVLAGLGALTLRLAPWDEPALLRGATANFRAPGAPDELAGALSKLSPLAGGWGPDGATLVYGRGASVDRVFIDGAPFQAESREADAERMLGALGSALAQSPRAALVLGDVHGLATAGLLEQGLERVTVAVSDPGGLRARAALDPTLAAVLLHPSVRLRAEPTELLLSAEADLDVLIEIARAASPDGSQSLPAERAMRRREAQLSDQGVYILVVPLHRLEADTLRGLLHRFQATFPSAWAALPPGGVDQLLLCGWRGERAPAWSSFVSASTRGLGSLTRIGVRSAQDLADRLVVDGAGMASVVAAGEARDPARPGLPANLHQRPAMLWPLFADALADPALLFGEDLDPAVLAMLRQRRDVNRDLLKLLDDAARGDVRRIYEQSQALTADPAGQRALNPLVRPYLERAEALIAKGMDSGPSSNVWSLCLRETGAARLLDPLSADVYAMSGKCNLASGDARSAEADFDAALRLDKGHEQALLGMAQLRVSRGEVAQAEQALREAVKYNPQSWRPRYHLGVLLLDLDRGDEAEAMLAQSRTLAGDRSALPYGALAHVALRRGDPNAALVYAERAVALDPVAKHLHLRGLAYFELGQLDQAERDFKDAIYTDPRWWPARGDLGRVMAMRGDYAAAAQAFTEVLNADPGNPGARENLSRVEEKIALERRGEPSGL